MLYPIIQAMRILIFISVVVSLCIISTKSDAARPEIGVVAKPEIGVVAKPKIGVVAKPKIGVAAKPKIGVAAKPKIWRSGCDWWGMNCATGSLHQRSPLLRAGK